MNTCIVDLAKGKCLDVSQDLILTVLISSYENTSHLFSLGYVIKIFQSRIGKCFADRLQYISRSSVSIRNLLTKLELE